MKTITIEIPQGYEVDNFDKLSGTIQFKEKKPRNVMERIKCVDDVLTDNNLTHQEFAEQCKGLTPDEVSYRIVKLLVKSLNEGWLPDWGDDSQYKWYPWFYLGGSSGFRFLDCARWFTLSTVGSRLCFKSREFAEYAAKQFTDVYKQFLTI